MQERKVTIKDGSVIALRSAAETDLADINEIYNHYVVSSTCTYQIEPETMEDRRAWFQERGAGYPVIVAESGGGIVGWASISKYKKRRAYGPTVENSVYVRHDAVSGGIGTLLLSELIRLAREAGHHSIIAGISAEQEASIALHEKLGFAKVAHLKEVGYKLGTWLDVAYYQLMLQE